MRLFSLAALVVVVATAAGCTVETVVEQTPENEQEAKSAILTTPQMERRAPEANRIDLPNVDKDSMDRIQPVGVPLDLDRETNLDVNRKLLGDFMRTEIPSNRDIREERAPFGP